ncbi:MAG: DNA-3-methyladenine glycosylase I [Micrococcus sp.]|nr:DNA-3-methyladenine glycosylase I [Micrococcus sp.]
MSESGGEKLEPRQDLIRGEDGRLRTPWGATDPLLREYYDTEWGLPVTDERGLFERLSLEAFQSGLSWRTVLAKRARFREVFLDFDPERVAAFGDPERAALLTDPGIIRNRLKVDAAIANAAAVLATRGQRFTPVHPDAPGAGPAWTGTGTRPDTGLVGLIWAHQPLSTPAPHTAADVPSESEESRALARTLKAHGFRFVGPTTCFALMEAIGMVDTHLVGSWRRGSSGIWT